MIDVLGTRTHALLAVQFGCVVLSHGSYEADGLDHLRSFQEKGYHTFRRG